MEEGFCFYKSLMVGSIGLVCSKRLLQSQHINCTAAWWNCTWQLCRGLLYTHAVALACCLTAWRLTSSSTVDSSIAGPSPSTPHSLSLESITQSGWLGAGISLHLGTLRCTVSPPLNLWVTLKAGSFPFIYNAIMNNLWQYRALGFKSV